MRITTYEKGGNSLNPLIRLSFFLMIILCLFVMPVSAWSDDFDDGEIASDWTISGTWNMISGGEPSETSINYTLSVGSGSLTQNIGSITPNYMSVYIRRMLSNSEDKVYLSDTQYFYINNVRESYFVQDSGSVSLGNVGLGEAGWQHFTAIRSGSNFIVSRYDPSGTLIATSTIAADEVGKTTEAKVEVPSGQMGVDNYELLTTAPGLSNSINWGFDDYTEGDTGSYTWTLEDGFWQNLLYKYRVQVTYNGAEQDTASVSQTGTRYHDFDTSGVYTCNLQYSGLIITNWITLDSDTVNVVPEVDSYINVPQTEYTGNSFEISYLYGRTPILPFLKISKRQIDNTYVDTDWINLIDSGIEAGTTYTPNLTIYESGTYLIGIYDVDLVADDNSLLVASDTIRIFYQDAIEQISITKSKIDTNNISIIGIGDTLTGNYQVDSINYTNTSVRLEIYNYENDIICFSIPRQKQKGTYQAPLSNQEYFNEYIDGVNTVYKVDSLFYTGNNQVRLAGYNSDGTYNQTIVFVNVTIDYVNSAGYSLILSKYSIVQNEEFLISVMCPTESTLNIWDSDGVHIKKFVISGNKDIKFSLPDIDKYYFSLQDPTGNLQASQQLTVLEGITEEIDVDEGATIQENTNKLLNSPYLIALFIMIVFLSVGSAGGINGIMITGVIGMGICVFMELLPSWLVFLTALVLIVVISKNIALQGGN